MSETVTTVSPRQEQTHQGDTESTEKTQTRTLLSLLCHWIGVGDRYHNKELDPPTHCACGSSSINESLKCLLNFSKASSGCCYPDSVVVSVCPCPPLWDCP